MEATGSVDTLPKGWGLISDYDSNDGFYRNSVYVNDQENLIISINRYYPDNRMVWVSASIGSPDYEHIVHDYPVSDKLSDGQILDAISSGAINYRDYMNKSVGTIFNIINHSDNLNDILIDFLFGSIKA